MTKFDKSLEYVSYRTCGSRFMVFTCILIFLHTIDESSQHQQERLPPMVAPSHYDNVQNQKFQHPPPPGPPGQPQQFGGQQQPVGQQQSVQYAQGYQQPPHHEAQHAHGPDPGHHEQKLLHATDMQHEKEHIAEHMDVPIDTSKMSEQELQFHYFKMHDNDNNNMLDGTELIKSLIHWHETGHDSPQNQQAQAQQQPQWKLFNDEELIALIDPILKMDDTNLDGYIDYPEFIRAQKKSAAAGAV